MNQRIAIISENSISFIETLLKIWSNHDCAVLIDCRLPPVQIRELLLDSNATTCYMQDTFISDSYDGLTIIPLSVEDGFFQTIPHYIFDSFQKNYSQEDAIIIYSSGTTGSAKGVILSHFAIQTNADLVAGHLNLRKEDTFLIVRSLAHSSALVCELLVALTTRTSAIVSTKLPPPRSLIAAIQRYCISHIGLNPSILSLIVRSNAKGRPCCPSLRVIGTSGATVSVPLLRAVESLFPDATICNTYGLTEAGPRVSAQSVSSDEPNDGSVGAALEGVKIKIINNNGALVSLNENGIIYVKTSCLFTRYTTGDRPGCSEGWLNTGDIGYWDRNHALHIVGRVDNMVICSGHNVYPETIEKLIESFPGVNDCLVFGVAHDIYGTQLICHYTASCNLNAKLIPFCRSNLASYQCPAKFVLVSKIPKTYSGKKTRL